MCEKVWAGVGAHVCAGVEWCKQQEFKLRCQVLVRMVDNPCTRTGCWRERQTFTQASTLFTHLDGRAMVLLDLAHDGLAQPLPQLLLLLQALLQRGNNGFRVQSSTSKLVTKG